MHRDITRRDFVHDVSLASLGLALPVAGFGSRDVVNTACGSSNPGYPPTRTGLRGSHPGSFEVAHQLAREGKQWTSAENTGESFDLVVVGGGISGLASAYYYRQLHGPDARILIIENHDDFGGHARRNEFHQGGQMRLSWGGVFNLEYPMFSGTANKLLAELGVDIGQLLANNDFRYGHEGKNGPAIFFDEQSFGKNVLSIGCSLRNHDLQALADHADEFPLGVESRESLKQFALARRDITTGLSQDEIHALMHKTSYMDFLVRHGGLTPEAAELFRKTTDGYWGVSADGLSVAECMDAGLPVQHLMGGQPEPEDSDSVPDFAMFPDGNASIARLLVRSLIPRAALGSTMHDIVSARFDYACLDPADFPVKLRLNSTAVSVQNHDDGTVEVLYVRDGKAFSVSAKHCILACYHSIIPYLCPQLPEAQKQAQRYQVKRPLVLTNVLLRSSEAFDKLGITGAYCPGRLHGATWLVKGVHAADYRHEWNDNGPVAMMFWGMPAPSRNGMDIKATHRDARARLLNMKFEDFEREIRTVLDGMVGPAGFDVQRDILAITVNRWPHGYAYDYLDLWDPQWPEGQAPHEIARKPFGNIAIANSDAGADAYTHVAIDEAWRAVNDLIGRKSPV